MTSDGDEFAGFAFVVDYECENCGYEWRAAYEQQTDVTEFADEVTVKDTSQWGHEGNYTEACDNCRLERDVTITDRNPVEEDE